MKTQLHALLVKFDYSIIKKTQTFSTELASPLINLKSRGSLFHKREEQFVLPKIKHGSVLFDRIEIYS